MTDHRWVSIPGYEGFYEASPLGFVRSVDREIEYVNGRKHVHRGVVLSAPIDGRGYRMIVLQKLRHRRSIKLHRIIAKMFVPGESPGLEVCHNDGVKANCAASNLRWDTKRENQLDVVRHGHHRNANKTHCKRGHEFTEANTIRNGEARNCRTCKNQGQNRRALARRQRLAKVAA